MKKNVFEQIRQTCKEVSVNADYVNIKYNNILQYAKSLPIKEIINPGLDEKFHYIGHGIDTLAFLIILDTINFGSGYFPYLEKIPGKSGYFTIAGHLKDFFLNKGSIPASLLADITVEELMHIFHQDFSNRVIIELIEHFTKALNDLGNFLINNFNGDYEGLIKSSDKSAEKLINLLTKMPYYNDRSKYKGLDIYFFKRAQILVADLNLAFSGKGYGFFKDIEKMTIFADNLVPHVLKLDGILSFDKSLESRIIKEELIDWGSGEEIEIRASALHAVELIKTELNNYGYKISSGMLDNFLWNKGQKPYYKAVPRHRTRCVFY